MLMLIKYLSYINSIHLGEQNRGSMPKKTVDFQVYHLVIVV